MRYCLFIVLIIEVFLLLRIGQQAGWVRRYEPPLQEICLSTGDCIPIPRQKPGE